MHSTSETYNGNRIIAFAISLLLFIGLIILFYFIVIRTPIPAFPEAGGPGIEIDFGNLTEGTGDTENDDMGYTSSTEQKVSQTQIKETNTTTNQEQILTNNAEETIGLNSSEKNNKPTINQNPTSAKVTPTEPKPSKELLDALSALKNKKNSNTGGDGTSGVKGNAGSPDGIPDGGGGGTGDGPGTGPGNGIGYDLKGRIMVKKPELMDDSQESGKVVVEIIVNESGKVTSASPGARGSTTSSSVLWSKARQAALAAKFSPSPNGVTEQRGTITFVFILN